MVIEKISGNLTDWSKYPPRVLFVLSCLCAAFLFIQPSFFEKIGLAEVQTLGRPYFGFGLLIFGLLFISYPLSNGGRYFWGKIRRKYESYTNMKRILKWLPYLTPSQKNILQEFIDQDTRNMDLDFSNADVKELANIGIIYLPSTLQLFKNDIDDFYTAYCMNNWVFTYLKSHPEVIHP